MMQRQFMLLFLYCINIFIVLQLIPTDNRSINQVLAATFISKTSTSRKQPQQQQVETQLPFVQQSKSYLQFQSQRNHISVTTTTTTTKSCILLKMSSSTTVTSNAIGFIGLGIMGEGMASRLVSENIAGSVTKPLIIWNRTKDKCILFKNKFPNNTIIIKDTAKEVVEACTIIYSILSTPEASSAVFDNIDTGVLAGISHGKSIIDCATLAESDMQRMNTAIVEKGGRFLEAPVSGSKGPAIMGTLIFLCSGSEELFNEIKDNGLNVMGKASHYFGSTVGGGTRAKLVVNSIMGTMIAAYSEGLVLSDACGLDQSTIINVINQGAINCPMFTLKGPKMILNDHDTNFPLKHATKDMTLAKNLAQTYNVEYTVINQAETLFTSACTDDELNISDEDFSAIYEHVRKESKK